MVLGDIFQPFVEKTPVSVMVSGTLERVMNAERLDSLFECTADQQYTRKLLFSSVVDVMSEVVCGVFPTVHAVHQERKETLGVSVQAVYDKLKCLETRTAAGLVRYVAEEVTPVIEDLGGVRPPLLPGYRVKLLDGNGIEASEHRIEELRHLAAGALPGKSLVVLDPALRLPIDVFPCEDGHAQERALLGEVLPTVKPGDAWLGDRNFCTRVFLFGIDERGGFFIVREHANLPWESLGPATKIAAKTETGKVFEQPIRVTDEQGRTLDLRRIIVHLDTPTQDGDTVLYLLTNLPKKVSRKKVAELYRKRWTIESTFQDLESHLNSEINTLGYPRAALFAFCIALVAYSLFAVVKAALAAVHGAARIETELSGYYLAHEISRNYGGMMIAIPEEKWMVFRTISHKQFVGVLLELANKVNLSKLRKHPRGPKKPPPKRSRDPKQPHVSTARIIANRKG